MPKYTAREYDLRMATSEADLATAPVLDHWEKVEISTKQGRKKVPVGIHSRLQEIHETLLDYSGSCSGWYSKTAVAGSSDILTAFGMFEQAELTPLYLSLTNRTENEVIVVKKIKADPKFTIDSPEGFAMWSVDFEFEDISKT
jgi:hypothetical protein